MAKYMIPNEFPSDLYDFAKPQARAHWTSYPTYSYEQFYRANPRGFRIQVGAKYGAWVIDRYKPLRFDDHGSAHGGEISLTNEETGESVLIQNDHGLRASMWWFEYHHRLVEEKTPTKALARFLRLAGSDSSRHNPADPKARYKALQAVADDERANENERKIARRLMSKMEAEGLVKPKKAKKNGSEESNALLRRLTALDKEIAALEAQGAKVPKSLLAELDELARAYKRATSRSKIFSNPRSHRARRNEGAPVFKPVASNAGPFTPNTFPYGVGGRPAVYLSQREMLLRDLLDLTSPSSLPSPSAVRPSTPSAAPVPSRPVAVKVPQVVQSRGNPRPGKYKSVQEAGGLFAIPEKAPREGSFPIDTIRRARYALALVAAPAFDEKRSIRARVIKAVVEAYPQLQAEADHVEARVEERARRSQRAAANPRRRR